MKKYCVMDILWIAVKFLTLYFRVYVAVRLRLGSGYSSGIAFRIALGFLPLYFRVYVAVR